MLFLFSGMNVLANPKNSTLGILQNYALQTVHMANEVKTTAC